MDMPKWLAWSLHEAFQRKDAERVAYLNRIFRQAIKNMHKDQNHQQQQRSD